MTPGTYLLLKHSRATQKRQCKSQSAGNGPARIFHKLTCALACLLILQENHLQSAVITDTPLSQKFPCKTNILRDHHTNL